MPRRPSDYLERARQFELLALTESCPQARRLMSAQAETCYKLAAKARETDLRVFLHPTPLA